MTPKEIQQFVDLAKSNVAYNETAKAEFHRQGKRYLRMVAKLMKLPRGTYEIRSNMGGIAVSGEVICHGEDIYISLEQSCMGPDFGFMYRKCKGRKDYCGLTNHWMKWDALVCPDLVATQFTSVRMNG